MVLCQGTSQERAKSCHLKISIMHIELWSSALVKKKSAGSNDRILDYEIATDIRQGNYRFSLPVKRNVAY